MNNIVEELKVVEEKYKDRVTSFGEVNISDMARDCRVEIERLQSIILDLTVVSETGE